MIKTVKKEISLQPVAFLGFSVCIVKWVTEYFLCKSISLGTRFSGDFFVIYNCVENSIEYSKSLETNLIVAAILLTLIILVFLKRRYFKKSEE